MKFKLEQTMVMEKMHEELLKAVSTARVDELEDIFRNILADGCIDVAVASVEDYLDNAPWSIHDAVAQFKGEA